MRIGYIAQSIVFAGAVMIAPVAAAAPSDGPAAKLSLSRAAPDAPSSPRAGGGTVEKQGFNWAYLVGGLAALGGVIAIAVSGDSNPASP